MSDEWNFYPCKMDGENASVFYDHGLRETIDQAPSRLLKVRLAMKQPNPDGLSSREEFKPLCALEDELQAISEKHDAVYAGRITAGGFRYFYVFTADPEVRWSARLKTLGERHGYKLDFALKADTERAGYWKTLYPSDDDMQVILDLRVLQALQERGDIDTVSRTIDHWAYFPGDSQAQAFSGWLKTRQYGGIETEATDEGKICVHFTHEGTVQLADITTHTLALRAKAAELGGDYDGWEAAVCQAAKS